MSMVAQASHQGTNPSAGGTPAGGSANASPNVNVGGKRRRASAVNAGEEAVDLGGVNGVGPGGGGPNGVGGGPNQGQMGVKVKQSPRVGGKRQKGNG